MISIGTNASALMAQAATASVQIDAETAMQRLSSGKRINAAKDDAAGVAIASRMTSHVKGLHQSIRNSMDAQALISTAEGGLQETEVLLQRIRELAVQASNDTNSDADRTNLNNEAQQLLAGIDAIASGTTWAGQNLLDGTYSNKSFHVGGGSMAADQVTTSLQSSTAIELGLGATTSTNIVTTTSQEPRTTYSTNDVDTPVKVNEYFTPYENENGDQRNLVTTKLSDGKLLLTWNSSTIDNDGFGISAKVFNSDGTVYKEEFRINDFTQNDQMLEHSAPLSSKVQALSTGGFAIVWESEGQDGDFASSPYSFSTDWTSELGYSDGVFMKVYDANFQGSNSIQVNQTEIFDQYRPSIAELSNGNIAVAFTSAAVDLNRTFGDSYGALVRVFNSAGSALTNEIKVNSIVNNGQVPFSIEAYDDGFVVGLASGHTNHNTSILQKFNNTGGKVGGNTALSPDRIRDPQIIMNDNGSYLHKYYHNFQFVIEQRDSSNSVSRTITISENVNQNFGTQYSNIIKLENGEYFLHFVSDQERFYPRQHYGVRLSSNLTQIGDMMRIDDNSGVIKSISATQVSDHDIWVTATNATGHKSNYNYDTEVQVISTEETTSTTTYETVTTTETVTSTVAGIDLTSGDLSREALTRLDTALQTINSQRAELGSLSNRLDHIIANNTNASTNTKASLGRIQDADFAAETTKLAKSKILEQSSTAMLAQANASVYEVLTLIPD